MEMKNSVYGIISMVFGIIGVLCLGNCVAFFPVAVAVIFALMGVSDPEKYKWSSITGIVLATVAILMCCANILIKNGIISTLLSGESVYHMTMDYY